MKNTENKKYSPIGVRDEDGALRGIIHRINRKREKKGLLPLKYSAVIKLAVERLCLNIGA